MLSGVIIFHVHGHDLKDPASARAFAGKRLLRTYAPYLPVGIAMIALDLMLPGLSASEREWVALTSLALVPSDRPPRSRWRGRSSTR